MTSEGYRQIVAASNHVKSAIAAVEMYSECGYHDLGRVLSAADSLALADATIEAEVAYVRALLAS